MNHFAKEDQLLISLQRAIENTDNIEANTVAFLSSKIQEVRASLRTKNVSLKQSRGKVTEKKLSMEKPTSNSLAEQKKREYYF